MKLSMHYFAELIIAVAFFLICFIVTPDYNMNSNGVVNDFNYGWTIDGGTAVSSFPLTWDFDGEGSACRLSAVLPDDLSVAPSLMFFTAHKLVNVYIDGEPVYSFTYSDNRFLRSPGNAWHLVRLTPEYGGGTVTVELIAPYDATSDTIYNFYIGTDYALIRMLVRGSFFAMFISILMVVAGFALVCVWFVQRKNLENNYDLLYLGVFAVIGSIWSALETQLPQLFFGNNAIFSELTWVLLLLVPYPFMSMIVSIFKMERSKFFFILKLICILNTCVQFILYAFGVFDFKEMYILVIGIAVLSIIAQLGFSVYILIKHKPENTGIILAQIISVFIVGIATLIDALSYYAVSRVDDAVNIRIGMFIYMILVAIRGLRNLSRQLRDADQKNFYEKLAYTDSLTGLQNRSAFDRDVSNHRSKRIPCAFVSLDLDNLKYVNDTFGHSYGDDYLTAAAELLSDSLIGATGIYRLGGDEFFAFFDGKTRADLQILMSHVCGNMESIRQKLNVPILGISYGIGSYTGERTESLIEMLDNADMEMIDYKQKRKLSFDTLIGASDAADMKADAT